MSDSCKDFRKRKHKKSYYVQPKKKAKAGMLQPGMKGILITCNTSEKECVREAYNLLSEYADKLYGPEEVMTPDMGTSPGHEDDTEKQLQKELQSLRNCAKTVRRFQQVNTRVKNCIFIQTQVPDPSHLVYTIFQDVKTSQQRKGRFILRMIPVMVTCKAFLENIKRGILNLVGHYPKPDGENDHVAYMMVFKARNNHHLLRDEVFGVLRDTVQQRRPIWTARVKDPDLVIIIDIVQSVCCLSIVKDYWDFRKYNLAEIVQPHTAKLQAADDTCCGDISITKNMSESGKTLSLPPIPSQAVSYAEKKEPCPPNGDQKAENTEILPQQKDDLTVLKNTQAHCHNNSQDDCDKKEGNTSSPLISLHDISPVYRTNTLPTEEINQEQQ